MRFIYENLGDERFQQFCQTLLTKEFPHIQSFPVGQPDGGRDAVSYIMKPGKKEFIVFQVKYVRNPSQIQDPHKWLLGVIEDEIPKIKELIPKGATQYYLITNVKGTAHLDKGSIDKLTNLLETELDIPALCWWRDDIDTYFEKHNDLFWVYSSILNGQDMINTLLRNMSDKDGERRKHIVKIYLEEQYRSDNEVKFRQVDLKNNIFDLFMDLPFAAKEFNENDQKKLELIEYFSVEEEDDENLNKTIYFLTHDYTNERLEQIVIEGGPGQGKSTLVQYLCQLYRVFWLNKKEDLEKVPENLRSIQIKLPFKIDLRHLANWVESKNPYKETLTEENFNKKWGGDLESFLLAQIYHYTKLELSDKYDLITLVRDNSILIVFDGFDEIADVEIRKKVVRCVDEGVKRLRNSAKTLQAIITSRPAALFDKSDFPVQDYPHLKLLDLRQTEIKEYVKKWVRVNNLDDVESKELIDLVREKIELPHIAELTKNPMQLAIFINLLHKKGDTLPEKRTALFDAYVDLFFDRESAKDDFVKKHRTQIIEIHQYLAWVLHSESELEGKNGTISHDELIKLLNDYLERKGYTNLIVEKMFNAMRERVCAIVSRVQGTYEFEVQPLREYFCARFLYKNAQYSYAGNEKKGNKVDILRAILRNEYWNNVVRFYAGCFDIGEISMLVTQLTELGLDEKFKFTDYSANLVAQLINDLVFEQSIAHLGEVMQVLVDEVRSYKNLERLVERSMIYVSEQYIGSFLRNCYDELKKFPSDNRAFSLRSIILWYKKDAFHLWLEYLKDFQGNEYAKWLQYGLLMFGNTVAEDVVVNFLEKESSVSTMSKVLLIYETEYAYLVNRSNFLKNALCQMVLNCYAFRLGHGSNFPALSVMEGITDMFLFYMIFEEFHNEDVLLTDIISAIASGGEYETLLSSAGIDDKIDQGIKSFYYETLPVMNCKTSKWWANLDNASIFVEKFRYFLGESVRAKQLATYFAMIDYKQSLEDYTILSDSSKPLCLRAKYAYYNRNIVEYWKNEFSETSDAMLSLLVFFTWANIETMLAIHEDVSRIFMSLTKEETSSLALAIMQMRNPLPLNSDDLLTGIKCFNLHLDPDILFLMALRLDWEERNSFVYDYCDRNGNFYSEFVRESSLTYLIECLDDFSEGLDVLNEISELYNSYTHESLLSYDEKVFDPDCELNLDIAKIAMSNPQDYPPQVVAMAQNAFNNYAKVQAIPVGKTAKEEGWFL